MAFLDFSGQNWRSFLFQPHLLYRNSSTYAIDYIVIARLYILVTPSPPQLLNCKLFEVKAPVLLIAISWTSTKNNAWQT